MLIDGDGVSKEGPCWRRPTGADVPVVGDGVSSTGDGVLRAGDGVLPPERGDPADGVGVLLEEDGGPGVGERVLETGDIVS